MQRPTDVRPGVLLLACLGLVAIPASAGEDLTLRFEEVETGKPPPDFSTALTGGGGPVAWSVVEDGSAPSGRKVLAQTSTDTTDYRFPLCVYDKLTSKDATVSVRLKAVSGRVDRAGGLVVRYRDERNYYIVRANALEDNVRLYKVVDGRRMQFAGTNVRVSSGEWHTLALDARGTHFAVSFDGKPLFTATDDTFSAAGRVGLWTKADSVTYFDDLEVEGHDAR